MTCLCFHCGTRKLHPMAICGVCHATPGNDDEIALSTLLTEQFLDAEKMETVTQALLDGRKVPMPDELKELLLRGVRRAEAMRKSEAESSIGSALKKAFRAGMDLLSPSKGKKSP